MRYLIFFMLLSQAESLSAQKASDVYYVSLGSVDYMEADQLSQASYAANRMAELLTSHAGAKGVKYVSTPEKKLSKAVFMQQLNKVWAMIKADNPPNPMLVIYFCGHGFSDSLVGTQFLFSGDYQKETKPTFETLMKKNIHLFDIQQWLIEKQLELALQKELRYLVLLDCCRDPFVNDALSANTGITFWGPELYHQMTKGLDALTRIVEVMYNNQFVMLDPIVFSTRVLAQADVTPYPKNSLINEDYSDVQVGPICRRSLLFLENSKKKGKLQVSLQQFVDGITDEKLDSQSDVSRSIYRKAAGEDCALFELKM